MSVPVTPYSHLTDEELVRSARQLRHLSTLELELVYRLEENMDYIATLSESIPDGNDTRG